MTAKMQVPQIRISIYSSDPKKTISKNLSPSVPWVIPARIGLIL